MQHHAYLVCGDRGRAWERVNELSNTTVDSRKGNPDIVILTYTQFTIHDARALKESSAQRPVRDMRRLFILEIGTILLEAQHALLKLFEEPPKESAFILLMRDSESLLPTLRSRLEVISVPSTSDVSLARQFLSLSMPERLELVAKKTKEKDEVWTETLLGSLEVHLRSTHDHDALRALLFVRSYIERRGASSKMLLEHLALSLSA